MTRERKKVNSRDGKVYLSKKILKKVKKYTHKYGF
jgi:hypothetical protein